MLRWVIRILFVLAVLFAGIGMLLPREVTVARAIEIEAPAAEIYPYINDLSAMEAWSPWLARDPEADLRYGEIASGVGATLDWSSDHPEVGSGSMEIVEAVPDARLVTALDFGGRGGANASFDLAEADGRTSVKWSLETDMGFGPMGRWMGLMMDGWVGADYELGLQNLKSLVEG